MLLIASFKIFMDVLNAYYISVFNPDENVNCTNPLTPIKGKRPREIRAVLHS
jgi:hypothetical protein